MYVCMYVCMYVHVCTVHRVNEFKDMQDPEEFVYIYYCAMPRSGTNGKIGVKQINFLRRCCSWNSP